MPSTSTTVIRPSLDNAESNVHIDKAAAVAHRLKAATLNIVAAQSNFDQKIHEFHDIDPTSSISARQVPSDITNEVEAQLSFLRKLKFNYLEQNAKDKYIKTIVDDESRIITADENEALRRSNEVKKNRLKDAKGRLAQRYVAIRELASKVEKQYGKADALTSESQTLTSQILDARLALSRLRASHPYPRMSLARANARLEEQTESMASLDAQLSENASNIEKVKTAVQDAARDVERLRVERAAKEEEARQAKAEEDDERIVGLYDWYSMTLSLHRQLFSLHESKLLSENELALTYHIRRAQQQDPTPVTVTLLFHPNTRKIADASVSSPDRRVSEMNMADLIGSHVQANDSLGLIRAVHARVRSPT